MDFGNAPDAAASYERIIKNLPGEKTLNIPLLRGLASPPGVVLAGRLERRYRRLCFVQEELGRLNALKIENGPFGENAAVPDGPAGGLAGSAASFEDFVFSHTDFSRYAKIAENDFDFFVEGIDDFDGGFFIKNFRLEKAGVKTAVLKAYQKTENFFRLVKANPLILSIMRTLETSLDCLPFISEDEILEEFRALYGFMNAGRAAAAQIAAQFTVENTRPFFRFLIQRLDGLRAVQKDGSETKLFINPEGKLRGTFAPHKKSWTLTLV